VILRVIHFELLLQRPVLMKMETDVQNGIIYFYDILNPIINISRFLNAYCDITKRMEQFSLVLRNLDVRNITEKYWFNLRIRKMRFTSSDGAIIQNHSIDLECGPTSVVFSYSNLCSIGDHYFFSSAHLLIQVPLHENANLTSALAS